MGSNGLFKPAKQDLGTRVPTMSERQPRGWRPLGVHAPPRLCRFDKLGFGRSRGEPGGAGVSRTRDLAIRNRSLYPTELQPRRLSWSPSLPHIKLTGARKPTHTGPLPYDNRTGQNRQSPSGNCCSIQPKPWAQKCSYRYRPWSRRNQLFMIAPAQL
jgi:hypothetical protein